jgi:hypothetical protein
MVQVWQFSGDYWDLRSVHETIHKLAAGKPLDGTGLSDFVLGLAYDIRHAYQGDREKERFGFDDLDTVEYRGVKVFWTVIIPQLGFLRWAAGFHATSKKDQANLFMLESCVESALEEYDREAGKMALDLVTVFQGMSPNYHTQYIHEVTRQYLCEGRSGKARFRILPEMLRRMSPISEEYRQFASFLEGKAKEKGCTPGELSDRSDWPEFKW